MLALEKQTDLQAAKIQCQLAQTALEEKTIRSPLAGIVVKRYKEPGESVDRTEKLFDIVNIDQRLRAVLSRAEVDREGRASRTRIPVHFPTLGSGSQSYEAAVSFVDPRIDAAQRALPGQAAAG